MQHKEKLVSFQAVSRTLINKVQQHVRRRRHPCSLVNELETTCMANLSTTGMGRRRKLRLTRTSYTGCHSVCRGCGPLFRPFPLRSCLLRSRLLPSTYVLLCCLVSPAPVMDNPIMLGLFDVSLPPLLSEPSLRVCTGGHQTLHLAASSHRTKRLGHSSNLSHLHLHGHSMLFMLDLTFAMVRILLAHDDTKLTVEPPPTSSISMRPTIHLWSTHFACVD